MITLRALVCFFVGACAALCLALWWAFGEIKRLRRKSDVNWAQVERNTQALLLQHRLLARAFGEDMPRGGGPAN